MENQNPNPNINPFPGQNQGGNNFNQGNNFNNPNQQNFGGNQPVPNSTAVLVLGIVSIVLCWCYGIVGLICAIVAMVISKKGYDAYNENPSLYTIASYNNLKAGRICGIIGLILGIIFIIIYVVYFIWIFSMVGSHRYPFR